jgi:hypothetical protein
MSAGRLYATQQPVSKSKPAFSKDTALTTAVQTQKLFRPRQIKANPPQQVAYTLRHHWRLY